MSLQRDVIKCSGCSEEISSGNIISFENDYWHPECFRCMKCNKVIDISDQNILLCEDKPICSDCGYKCHICGKAITGEAITADDMIMHFSCFKCQCCGKYIDDLTYVLVNNEIRCINCTYNIDEDVQNDFGISSPSKSSVMLDSEPNSPSDNINNQDTNSNTTNDLEDNDRLSMKDKGKRLTAKHCSMLQDKNAIHRMSVVDKKLELKTNNSTTFEPNLSSFAEEKEEEEEMDKNPNQHHYYMDNKKFTDEEYYILKVKNEQLIAENNNLKDKNDILMSDIEELKQKFSKVLSENENLKDINEQFSSKIELLKREKLSDKTKYEEKIEEEKKKSSSYEKAINVLVAEKETLENDISKANEKINNYEDNNKLDILKYENENNLFQIKYEDLKEMYDKEREERIIAESTIVRLQEEIHIRYLDELKYTYIYDIEAKYQSEFEILESQKQCSLSTLEYLNNEIKKIEKEKNSSKVDSETNNVYDFQSRYNEISNKYKNELSNIQNQKKLLQNEVNLLRNLRKGLINDNLIYMERFRKLKSEEASLQKKKQRNSRFNNKNSLYKSNNESVYFKYDIKNEESNFESPSIYDLDINTITLQRMESSVNNSFAVYEYINKMINDSFQPQKNNEKSIEKNNEKNNDDKNNEKNNEKNLNFTTIISDDSKESLNDNLNTNELKTPLTGIDEKSINSIPLNDSLSVPQSKSNTIQKFKKGYKKIYASESMLFDETKKSISIKENSNVSTDELQKSSGNTSPLKLKIPETSHTFQFHKFLTPSKCEFCTDIIWGREVKCKCCGIKCHVRCITDKIPECSKKTIDPEIAALYSFGTDLSKQATIEPDNVPFIVKKCTEEVEKRGMDFEGIYRKSGRTLLMKNLISIFSRGEDPDLSEEGEFSEITVITSVLKQYFRELPEAVIPPDVYSKLSEIISNEDKELDIEEVKKCIDTLEDSHYSTLRFIVKHLIKVSQFSNVNLMTMKNLAVVFGPTLIGSNEICPEVDFSSTGIKVKIINVILKNEKTIFFQES